MSDERLQNVKVIILGRRERRTGSAFGCSTYDQSEVNAAAMSRGGFRGLTHSFVTTMTRRVSLIAWPTYTWM